MAWLLVITAVETRGRSADVALVCGWCGARCCSPLAGGSVHGCSTTCLWLLALAVVHRSAVSVVVRYTAVLLLLLLLVDVGVVLGSVGWLVDGAILGAAGGFLNMLWSLSLLVVGGGLS